MPNLVAARAALAFSLAFHIIFAALSIGLPVLMCVAEGLGLRGRDAVWYALARRWSKAAGILVIIGAVSGTALSFELGLLWPRFMGFSTGVIGLPFALEGFCFFLEAIFTGLYLYGWDRLAPRAHWLCSLPIVATSALATGFIISVNSWMNTPTGFRLVNGKPEDVAPLRAMLNPSTPASTLHMLLACYQMTFFLVAGVYAFGMLRGRRGQYYRRGLLLSVLLGTAVAPLQAVAGDLIAEVVAQYQPLKLATMEGLVHTAAGAPETILGIPNYTTGQVRFALQIPRLLSLLAFRDPNATVQGMEAFPRADWPEYPLLVHYAFNIMVGIGGIMILVSLWFWLLYFRRHRTLPTSRWPLWALAITGPLGIVAVECGWIVTEGGRQPWIIYNIMRVSDAVTDAPGVWAFFFAFLAIYLVLAGALLVLALRLGEEKLPYITAEQARAEDAPVESPTS
jgi:cytochrome d ubiquinol oxidase subunit I